MADELAVLKFIYLSTQLMYIFHSPYNCGMWVEVMSIISRPRWLKALVPFPLFLSVATCQMSGKL